MPKAKPGFQRKPVAHTISVMLAATGVVSSAFAEQENPEQPKSDDNEGIEEIIVTGSRRKSTIQETPYNISAVTGESLEKYHITDLSEFTRTIPGLYMPDNGVRGPSQLIMRGINVDGSASSEGIDADSSVSVYIGETPLYLNMKMVDINRVEVLRGPQGTLYGAGSLAGTIRYIPNKPNAREQTLLVAGKTYGTAESSGLSIDTNIVFNMPVIEEKLAFRAAFSYLDEKGFIDNPYLVKTPGISNPQDPNDLYSKADVNTEEAELLRLSFLWNISDSVELTTSYTKQNSEGGARQVSHYKSITFPTGKYESAERYLEPNDTEVSLFNMELQADLGFADLLASISESEFDETGQRDQTDLLLRFEYGYEDFPAFSSFTREVDHEENSTREIRLVSKAEESRFNWIIGYFDFKEDGEDSSREFTPGIPEFWDINRPDALEYIDLTEGLARETAFYGELGFRITEQWQVTVGVRGFEFEDKIKNAVELPLLRDDLPASEQITMEFLEQRDVAFEIDDKVVSTGDTTRDDTFYKFNTSVDITDDLMVYFTHSEGFRRGGANSVRPCTVADLEDGAQSVCATEDERFYNPDSTVNQELGFHSAWLENRLTVNGAYFSIDWDGVQVAGITANGDQPITENGNDAQSRGIELEVNALLGDHWTVSGGFSYTDAELSTDASQLDAGGISARSGARLPGSPKKQAYVLLSYETGLRNGMELSYNYLGSYSGDIYTQLKNADGSIVDNGDRLGSITEHRLSVDLMKGDWSVSFFIDNLSNSYRATNARDERFNDKIVGSLDVGIRRHFRYVNRPRNIGIGFRYQF